MKHLKGFLLTSVGLFVFSLTVAVILTSYRGTTEYLQEFKEFRGALSRTMGGDYVETRQEAEPLPADFSQLDSNDLEQWLYTAQGELELRKKEKKQRR